MIRSGISLFSTVLMTGVCHAATIYSGTISPVNGEAVFDNSASQTYLFSPGVTNVTLQIASGAFTSSDTVVNWSYAYSYFDAAYPGVDFGNNSSGGSSCSFASGSYSCFETTYNPPVPAIYVSNFLVTPQSISYTVTAPQSYDHCNGSTCAESWQLNQLANTFEARISASNPVTYSLRFDHVDAVPEPASWAMLIAGFGMVGGYLRRRPHSPVRYI